MLSQRNPPASRFRFPTAGLGPEPLPLTAQYARANEVLGGLFQAIFEIDTGLFRTDDLLDRAQPSADGKVSIRFRRSRQKTVDGQAPAHFSHVNFRGTVRFGVEKIAPALSRRVQSRETRAAS